MKCKVTSKIIAPARNDATCELHKEYYLEHEGLKLRQLIALERESDSFASTDYRDSLDNGRTWGEWQQEEKGGRFTLGEDEAQYCDEFAFSRNIYNPVYDHYVSVRLLRIFIGGYINGSNLNAAGGKGVIDHSFVTVKDNEGSYTQMIAYEDGVTEFDEKTYNRDPEFLYKNNGYSLKLYVMPDGDVIFLLEGVPMYKVCDMLNLDVNEVFPSNHNYPGGIIVVKGKWDNVKKRYDLSFSKPVYLTDKQSSRGALEPTFARLKSGKHLLIIRMSNSTAEHNSKICPFTPSYKMFSISEDDCKTFSAPMPWYFDTKEVVYCSSSYSILLRSIKNDRLYWIGNITDPGKNDGNYPRYPLYIAEVDEEWGILKKDTLTLIDTKKDDEYECVQLSNFNIIQNRETKNFEMTLTKIQQFPDRPWQEGDVMKYTIEIPE